MTCVLSNWHVFVACGVSPKLHAAINLQSNSLEAPFLLFVRAHVHRPRDERDVKGWLYFCAYRWGLNTDLKIPA